MALRYFRVNFLYYNSSAEGKAMKVASGLLHGQTSILATNVWSLQLKNKGDLCIKLQLDTLWHGTSRIWSAITRMYVNQQNTSDWHHSITWVSNRPAVGRHFRNKAKTRLTVQLFEQRCDTTKCVHFKRHVSNLKRISSESEIKSPGFGLNTKWVLGRVRN